MDRTEVQPSPNHGFSFLGSDSKISKTFPSMSVQRNAFWPDQSWIRLTFTSTRAYLQAQNVLIKHQDRSRFSTTTLTAFIFDLKAQAFSASTRFCTVFGRELAFRPTNVFGFPIKLLDEEDLTVISLKLPSRAREIL